MSSLALAVAKPIAVLAFALVVPLVTGRLLAALFLRRAPSGGEDRARALVPYRSAAFVVGFAQLELAWIAGVYALGPPLVPQSSALGMAFGVLAAVVAFAAGGVARRAEEEPSSRPSVRGVVTLRLRLAAFLVGPLLTSLGVQALPVVTPDGAVNWGWVGVALGVSLVGMAYAGLATALVLRALVPASAAVTALAREVAAREGTRLLLVLRLPTSGTRFANAAAIPWARTMVVTDGIVDLLAPDELAAVLAHEAGHLSEPPKVMFARLGAATLMLFALAVGTRIAGAYGLDTTVAALLGVVLALGLLLAVRRLARRMEERADARACATVGREPLARALVRLHGAAHHPLVTGARRTHPDLYDRLRALGVDPGPRPSPPPRRRGLVAGLAIGALVGVGGYAAIASASDSPADAVNRGVELSRAGRDAEAAAEYRLALELDPDNAIAHYDLAIALERLGRADEALAHARRALDLDPSERTAHLVAELALVAGQSASDAGAERAHLPSK